MTKERIADFERIIGVELPEQYKRFFLEHNGGSPRPPEFLFQREGEDPQEGIVAWFLAIHDGPHENILRFFKMFQGRIPADTVSIARDPGGDLILLGIRGPLRGKVFFWTSELETDDGTPTEPEMLYHVADSFDEFLKSLGKV
ncbi:SMI1/KNR4 family protein [Vitiosangium sp. GDMCC 1.1324]|uniref:SMI1/KNR4 family protein n=1 Tax=Vitiosangium sp. (strain GDMCC 1.1324) TaxID=2138576 RepID=UPI00130EBA44|nr:SMI1/KNR4 family protein [Vitiosangium sp. GDMCC 1.1324]